MIFYFNAPFLYWEKCEMHSNFKESIQPLIEDDYLKNRSTYRENSCWDCNSTSSFHSQIDSENDSINEKIFNNEDFTNSIFLTYNNMLQKLFEDGSIIESEYQVFQDCYLEDVWYNYYESGENQDIHEHTPNTFSGIYLLDIADVNNTVWYNSSATFPCDSRSVFDRRAAKEYDLTEGSIIIFPSRLSHFVPPVNGKKITISFNIRTNE